MNPMVFTMAVDEKEKVIIACFITDAATDHHQFIPLTENVKENVGTPDNVGADAEFFSYENLKIL